MITDDHQLVIDGLKALLKESKDVKILAHARNVQDLIKHLRLIRPDVILMDIDMPVVNGIEATKRIKGLYPDIKIIALAMHGEKGMIKTMMQAGAEGYLLKSCDEDELCMAIKKVHSGQKYFSSEVADNLLSSNMEEQEASSRKVPLTAREEDILKLVSQGLSNKEIGEKLFISHRTVDTHRTNLMNKLDIHNVAGLIRYAIAHGYVQ
jgi:two-component system, NarL family, nitrate/nitrite response regulator NarL